MTINNNIKRLRGVLGLTLAEFGGLIGLTPDRLSKIENGHGTVSAQLVDDISKIFHVKHARMYDEDFLAVSSPTPPKEKI